MFSTRTNWNHSPNRLSALAGERRRSGISPVDLTSSNPGECGFVIPPEVLHQALSHPDSSSYQPDPRGLVCARQAIARYYSSIDTSVDPDRILLTSGTSEAYSYLLKLLCNSGDAIAIPHPGYPLLEYLGALNDVHLRSYRLAYDGEWSVDFESMEEAMAEGVRAVILVHPNIPTGSFLKQDEFDRVCRMARERDCAVICDEVFRPYAFQPDARRADIPSHAAPPLLFILNGISKLLALPQMKVSWMIVDGEAETAEEAMRRLELIADTYLTVGTPVQRALPELLEIGVPVRERIRTRTRDQYHSLQRILEGSGASVLACEGGWNAVLRLPAVRNDEEWAYEILSQLNILVQPGHYYELESDSHVVLSLLTPSDRWEPSLRQLRNFIDGSA